VEDYRGIAQAAKLDGDDPLQVVILWLTELSENRIPWLLVLDHFGSKQGVEKYLPRTGMAFGCVLVTSIRCFGGPARDDEIGPLEIGPLRPEDASQLLLSAANKKDAGHDEQAACLKLVNKLSFLPLAIIVAGSHIRNHKYSIAEYLEQWQIVFSNSSSYYSGHPQSVDATLRTSYAQLKSSDESNDAIGLLHFFAFLHSEHASTTPGLEVPAYAEYRGGHSMGYISPQDSPTS
jgi:hypothetical protein